MKKFSVGNLRTAKDGKPFFCKKCGKDYYEWLSCRGEVCTLEEPPQAQLRMEKQNA